MSDPGANPVGWQLHRPSTEPVGWERKQFVWPRTADIVVTEAWNRIAPALEELSGHPVSRHNPIHLGWFLEYLAAEYLAGEGGAKVDPTLSWAPKQKWH